MLQLYATTAFLAPPALSTLPRPRLLPLAVFLDPKGTKYYAPTRVHPSNHMPTSTRYSRPSISSSPPLSSAYSVSHATAIAQQKLNVVTRLAIEGRAERGANGAGIHMYLKVSAHHTPQPLVNAHRL